MRTARTRDCGAYTRCTVCSQVRCGVVVCQRPLHRTICQHCMSIIPQVSTPPLPSTPPPGWFATAPFLGGFGADARKKGVPTAAATAAKCWAVGVPLGLVIRGLSRGYVPPTPFIAVSMGVTAVLLVGWRSALAATTKPVSAEAWRGVAWRGDGEVAKWEDCWG